MDVGRLDVGKSKITGLRGGPVTCHFCDVGTWGGGPLPEDQILLESEAYYVKPGLGHFVEGYTLINSKKHVQSFSFLSPAVLEELEFVVGEVRGILGRIYGCGTVMFEHGEVGSGVHPGCCFEHAHMHVLPLPPEISDVAVFGFEAKRLRGLRDLSELSLRRTPYLLFGDRAGVVTAHLIDRDLESQFLRRELCLRLGMSGMWDWAVFPFRERIGPFVEKVSSAVRSDTEMRLLRPGPALCS